MLDQETKFEFLKYQVRDWRRQGLRVVLCHGCFDFLHIGHVLHFRAAKKYGDKLVVTITPDVHINKGSNRPYFEQELRLDMVNELEIVDAAAVNLWSTAVETLQEIQPDIFAKGSDYLDPKIISQNFLREKQTIERLGGQMIFTEELTYSSTQLLKELHV